MIHSIALLLLSVLAPTQDDEPLAKGQKYLDKIAKVWSEKLPQEKLCGVYFGRVWVGSTTYTVKAAPPGGAATYEITVVAELNLMGQTMKAEYRALLAKDLSPISGESSETEAKSVEKRVLTVADGKWKIREDKNGEVKEREGKIGPGVTFEGNFLPLFAAPDEDCRILALDSRKSVHDFKKLAEKRELSIGGKKESCTILQIQYEGKEPGSWFFAPDGRAVEFGPEGPLRVRAITEAQRGKKLEEPLDVKPAERRLLDLFLAIKKGDSAGVEGSFDFDRFASEVVGPKAYADLAPEKQKETVEAMRSNMIKNLLSEQMREQLPDASLLEDALAQSMKSTEKDGIARVQIKGSATWKLHQPKDGPRKGMWLIFGVGQD